MSCILSLKKLKIKVELLLTNTFLIKHPFILLVKFQPLTYMPIESCHLFFDSIISPHYKNLLRLHLSIHAYMLYIVNDHSLETVQCSLMLQMTEPNINFQANGTE